MLPLSPGEEPLILFFLGLPMGWVLSPSVFYAATKTVADIAQDKMDANWHSPPTGRTTRPTPPPRMLRLRPCRAGDRASDSAAKAR